MLALEDEQDASRSVDGLNEQYEVQKRVLDARFKTRSRKSAAATTCRRV